MNRLLISVCIFLVGCAAPKDEELGDVNFDHLIGQKPSVALPNGRRPFNSINVNDSIEELVPGSLGPCAVMFGVRKSDDTIVYWKFVSPPPRTCKKAKRPWNYSH
jgi:hypothetical protein